jgi:ABC-type glutathione transport system ATPase component
MSNNFKHLRIVLVGPTGSGKTTMARLLTRFLRWQGYTVDHVPIPGDVQGNVDTMDARLFPEHVTAIAKRTTVIIEERLSPRQE